MNAPEMNFAKTSFRESSANRGAPNEGPRIAVIVPAYGVADLLGEALGSVTAQTFQNWECIVVDDGAPDDVASAVAPFLSDPRIQFLATDNGGVSKARNRAIAQTMAPYIALLDGDDLFRPDYLAEVVAALDTDPDIRIATCNARMFGAIPAGEMCVSGKQGKGDGTQGSLCDVLDRSFNVYIGSAFRRSDFDAIGGFDEGMTHSEDFDLWVRLMLLGGHAHYIDKPLGEYRVRPNSASASGIKMLNGNLRVYNKAREKTQDAKAATLLDQLIAEQQAALTFEKAIAQILEGDVRGGLEQLRSTDAGKRNRGWRASLILWRIAPWLARPMLQWRANAHAWGRSNVLVPALGPAAAIALLEGSSA